VQSANDDEARAASRLPIIAGTGTLANTQESVNMTTALETPLRAKTLSPGITVDDLPQSIKFFEGLGFGIEERWEENGVLLGVMMRAGEARIGVNQDDWKKGRNRQKGAGMRIFVGTTQDIDQLAARAKAAGVNLDAEPHDTPWGSRAFEVTEPSGFKLTIASEV